MTKHQLPNLFDQYSQDENRVTNALLQTLAVSPSLTKSFLRRFLNLVHDSRSEKLTISAQKRPKELGDRDRTSQEVEQQETIPDGWILSEKAGWVVVLESKIYRNSVRLSQLDGHIRGIRGTRRTYLLVMTPDETAPEVIPKVRGRNLTVRWIRWEDIHSWVVRKQHAKISGAIGNLLLRNLREFLEMYEKLSGFQGIDLVDGYNTQRAKSLLLSLMDTIRPKVLKIYPELKGSRGGITTFGRGIWDCFGVEPNFTDDLHFTLVMGENEFAIALTVPNGAKMRWKQLSSLYKDPAYKNCFQKVINNLSSKVPELWIRLEQRHFVTRRRSVPDGRLDFCVDTAPFARKKGATKNFPVWFDMLLQALESKKGVNLQLQIRAPFGYDNKKTQGPGFADVTIEILRSFNPLYKMLRS